MTKLAQGLADLHSKRGSVDLDFLAKLAGGETAAAIREANSAKHAFEIAEAAGVALGDGVAQAAWRTAAHFLRDAPCELEIVVFDRDGGLLARTGFLPVEDQDAVLARNPDHSSSLTTPSAPTKPPR
jgi:cobalt-precorrin-5B (C1)-methyltransferase